MCIRDREKIAAAQENDEVILGYIKNRVNGGMIVDIFGIEAFLPGSQIDVRPVSYTHLEVYKRQVSIYPLDRVGVHHHLSGRCRFVSHRSRAQEVYSRAS